MYHCLPDMNCMGLLLKIGQKWRYVWSAFKTVTNLLSQPSPFRVSAFITCIGPDTLDIHNGLALENELEKQNIEKIFDLWNSYCLGETNVIYERFKFNNRRQTPDESVDAFAAALVSWLPHAKSEICRTNSFATGLCLEFQTSQCNRSSCRSLNIAHSAKTTTAQLKVITGQTDD